MSGTFPSTIAVASLPGAAAAAVAWRWRGQLWITVIAKATFAFAPDADMLRVAPEPILTSEVHHDRNPGRSIRAAGDLAPHLGRADVLFTGSAHAPEGTRAAHVRMAIVGPKRALLDKWLLVQDAAGFTRLPLVYEGALRGPTGVENPFGVAKDAAIVDPARPDRPAGFGPIARTWPARKRLLGALPRRKLEGPIAEIPDDFDWSYYQAAPADQQTEHLGGGEWIMLEGLSPAPLLRTRLPDARGVARLHGLAAFGVPEGQPLDLVADTLAIDGDEQRCAVVWRKSFAVPSEAALASARIAAAVELPGELLAWPDPGAIAALASLPAPPAQSAETVALLPGAALPDEAATIALLPFAAQAPAAAMPFRPGAPSAEIAAPAGVVHVDPPPATGTFMLDPAARPAPTRALPFAPAAAAPRPIEGARVAPSPAVTPPVAPAEHVDTGTLALMARMDGPTAARTLPFPGRPALVATPPVDEAMIDEPTREVLSELELDPDPEPEPDLPIAPVIAAAPAPAPIVHEAQPSPSAPSPSAPSPSAPSPSPWAPPPPQAAPPAPPPPPPALPTPSPALKSNLYGSFNRNKK